MKLLNWKEDKELERLYAKKVNFIYKGMMHCRTTRGWVCFKVKRDMERK